MELQEMFKRLGYPKHSDKVYRTLHESKEALSVAGIAAKIHTSRVVVYRCIEKMMQDALIQQEVIGRRTFYIAGSPQKLARVIKITEEALGTTLKKYQAAYENEVPQGILFFSGAAGIRAAFDDVIKHTPKGETFYRYTSERDLAKVNSYLSRDYRESRDKKKLERKVISNSVSGKQKRSRLERFIKFIPHENDTFEQNIIQLLYGNRMSIIDLNSEEVMIIENKKLVDFQKAIFNLLYKRL